MLQFKFKVCLNRYSWGAGKVGSEYSSWFMQIGLKMEAGDCPTLNMNAMENYLLSHSLMPLFNNSGQLPALTILKTCKQ